LSSHILYCYPVVLQDDNSDDTNCQENIKRWCNYKCVDFKNNINVNTVDQLLHMFETDSALNNDFINDIVDNIGIILTEAAKQPFGVTHLKAKSEGKTNQDARNKP